MFELCLVASILLGAFGRRAAGGALNQWTGHTDDHPLTGDLPTRLLYGVCLGLAALIGGSLLWQAALMIPAVFVGTTTGNNGSMDMARAEDTFEHDWWGMTLHGLESAFLPALVVALPSVLVGHWGADLRWLWTFGLTLAASPFYWVGWVISGAHGRSSLPIGLRGGSELGEAFWGGACGLGVFLAFAA